MKTGAELFVDSLYRLGIRELFTLVGDHLNEVLLCANQRGFRIVDMRHEAAVVHAADVWARIHRRPAVSLVTGGPGHTNSLTGLATAFLAGSPVITVSGASAASQRERGAFQDLDQLGMAKPVVKWAGEPPATAQISRYVQRAWTEATSGRMGPVHLTIPVDFFTGSCNDVVADPVSLPVAKPAPQRHDIEIAVEMLRQAQRPIIIAGSGIWWSGAEEELRAFAERTFTPIYTIGLGRGTIADDHPLCFGYADPALNRAAAKAFHECDLILVLGKRLDFRLAFGGTRLFPPQTRLIQVDIEATELNKNRTVDLPICADLKSTLEALSAQAQNHTWASTSWLERQQVLRADWQATLRHAAGDRSAPLHPAALFAEIAKVLPREALFSWDGGDFAHWGRAMLTAIHPGGWVRLGPLATIGAALPNALALQLAHHGKLVVMITGDGALGFYIAELDTAVRHGLPVVIIVGNDAGWGLERELQGGTGTVGCELRATRYDKVMEGFGGAGENVSTLDEIGPALHRAIASGRPYLINVNVRGARSPFTKWKLGED